MSTVKLECLSEYRHSGRNLYYAAGEVFEADSALAAFLAADAPGCFAPYKEPAESSARALDEPPANKMIGSPPAKKSWGDSTVTELREELARRGLPVSGNKSELIERLEEAGA